MKGYHQHNRREKRGVENVGLIGILLINAVVGYLDCRRVRPILQDSCTATEPGMCHADSLGIEYIHHTGCLASQSDTWIHTTAILTIP